MLVKPTHRSIISYYGYPEGMKLIFSIALVCLYALLSPAQAIGQTVNLDTLYERIYASDWDNLEVSSALYREAVDIIMKYPENRKAASFCPFITRQVVVLFSGVGNDSVQRVFRHCSKLLAKHDSTHRYRGAVLRNRGIYAMYRGDYDSAYSFYNQALTLFKESLIYCPEKDLTTVIGSMASCYGNMGHAIFSTTRFDDPIEKRSTLGPVIIDLFVKADSLYGVCEMRNNDPCYSPVVVKINLANTYGHYYKNEFLSESYYAEALERIKRCNDSVSYCQLYNSVAYTKLSDGDTSAAIYSAQKAIYYSRISSHTSKSAFSRYEANSLLATIYFDKKDFGNVIDHGNAVFADSIYIRKPIDIASISGLMAEVYAIQKAPESALKYLLIAKRYLEIYNVEKQQNRIVSEANSRKVNEVISRIMRLESQVKRNDSARTRWVIALGATVLIFTMMTFAIFWFYFRVRSR